MCHREARDFFVWFPFFTLSFNPRRGDAHSLSMRESGIGGGGGREGKGGLVNRWARRTKRCTGLDPSLCMDVCAFPSSRSIPFISHRSSRCNIPFLIYFDAMRDQWGGRHRLVRWLIVDRLREWRRACDKPLLACELFLKGVRTIICSTCRSRRSREHQRCQRNPERAVRSRPHEGAAARRRVQER